MTNDEKVRRLAETVQVENDALLPCPCCGCNGIHNIDDRPYCEMCGLEACSLEEWNTRSIPAAIQVLEAAGYEVFTDDELHEYCQNYRL